VREKGNEREKDASIDEREFVTLDDIIYFLARARCIRQ